MQSTKIKIAKTISYRLFGSIIMACVLWLFTTNVALSITIASLDVVIKLCAYYMHETIWDKIKWGTTANVQQD